jgi:hypothetical protein
MERYCVPDDWDVVQAVTNARHKALRRLSVILKLTPELRSGFTLGFNSGLAESEDIERVVATRTHKVWG